ncbi:putative Ig domain-containing protein [Dyella sp.]|uniref:putative Ig domain-containing protein n=1 Tax=Dyella sp. TaxID=1869338 RepID=UPI002ED49428
MNAWLRLMALCLLFFGFAGSAWAACSSPQTATIAAGGSATFSCSTFGFETPPNTPPNNGTLDFSQDPSVIYHNTGGSSDTFVLRDSDSGNLITFNITITGGSAPTAGASSTTVAYGSTNSSVNLNITGGTPTSVAVATQASHGTATASGTTITYTPATGYAGPDSFTYTATNGSGTSSPATATITVSPPTITYAPAASPNPTAGASYNHSIAGASGGAAPYTYAVTTGTLPAGLSLASNGTISGTPTAVGTVTVKVTATDSSTGTGPFSSAPANVTLTVNQPVIVISPTTLPAGTVNSSYSVSLSASGGTSPYSYTLSSGSLPAGMTLASNGLLSGTPTQAGNFNITVLASDATTGPAAPYSGSRSYTLQVAAPTINIAPSSVPNGTVDLSYSQTFTASGGTAPYTFSISGALPAGLNFNQATGVLSGTPTGSGDFPFTVTATDAQSFSNAAPYTLHVAAVVPHPPTIGTATAGAPGSGDAQVSFTAPSDNGGSPITGYTVTSSPGGITASGPGSPITITGLTSGTGYTFTVTATNDVGTSAASAQSNSVTVQGSQTITFNNPGSQLYGTTPTLTASASSGLPVSFSSETTSVCTITSGGTLTFLAAGTCSIDANQPGNATYAAAPQVQQNFQVAGVGPGAPTIGTATGGDGQATVQFTPPSNNGGSAITQYTVTSNPGGLTASGTQSPITVVGLTDGTAYTFTVTATNGSGTGPASSASNSVTPQGNQTITFNNPGSQNFGTSPTLTATSSSGLPVSFTSVTTAVCTITAGGTLTTVTPGTCTIHADQAGNGAFHPAATVSQSFTIVVPGGAVSFATPSPLPTATGGSAYSLTISAVGGAMPYTFQLISGVLPTGIVLNASGTISGTPINSGTYNFTLRVTDAATQTDTKNYQLVVNAPTIALAPTTLPQGKVGNAYTTTTLSASGGSAPYTFAVTSGSLPTGLVLSPAGVLSGSPTAPGSFNFTVTATDHLGFQGSQAYTVAVNQATPIVVNGSTSVPANGSVTIPVASEGGPVTSITVTQQPAHGTATVNGLNIVYAPASNYFGSDSLQYTATGPGGTSSPATETITVIPGAVPTAAAQSATLLAGKSVTIHAAANATNGPFVSAAVVTPPASGTTQVQGTDIVYTATADASGTVGFDYTVSNPFGASQPAHVTLTVNPLPVAPSLTSTVIAGNAVQVNLTATAHGGPFTSAKLVSISPSNAGSASIKSTTDGYVLTFVAAPAFSGSAQLTYTISNAYAESAPGTVNVSVAPRSDPSKDAEVLGVLSAQADAARRMATGQIDNFQRRLETLHSGGGASGFSNGITMTSASSQRHPDALADLNRADQAGNSRFLVQPDAGNGPAQSKAMGGSLPGDISVWTGGAVNFGKMQAGTSDNGIDFTTSGVSMGVDKAFSSSFAAGFGVGYGHDISDVGQHNSRSSLDSYNVALYASYHPADSIYVDGVLGYQWLSYDARRYVTDDGNTVHGSRDGKQYFGSISAGYVHQADNMTLTPYGRLDIARAHLDGYTESGDALYSLAYQRQTVKTSTGTLGLLAQWTAKRDYGIWSPQLRVEFGHDMQGSSTAAMRYADTLDGPLYQATLMNQSRNHTMLGAGVALQMTRGWLLRAEYQNYLDNTSKDNQSILLGVEKKFDP